MKKNFVKKLSVALALAMTVSTLAPAAGAEAAAAPTFKSSAVNVKVGQTKKYNTVNSKKYSVKFVIGNKSVATIKYSKGSKAVKVTGVTAGTTKMRAEFKSYKTKKVTTVRVPVTVKPLETAIVSAAQNTTTKVTATFEGDTSAVKAENFVITKDDNSIIAIKSAAVDTVDKSKVVIETYTEMKDGATYTITFNDKSKASFKATDGTVANVNLDTLVVTAAKAEEVKVQTLDAAGVILGAYTLEDAGSNNLEYSIETTDGYVDGTKLYLTEVGKTAKAKVVYHTWKYDEAGNETGKIEREFTITAVKDATVISNFAYTIAKAKKAPAWNSASFKVNTSIAANDQDMEVFFNIKDSKNEQADYTAYTVASSDTSKLIVDETKLTDNATGISVVGVNAGTAYILLKNEDGNTVKTFPVTVLADRKAAVLTVDASAFVLSNGKEAKDTKTVTLTVKDQYGIERDFDDAAVEVEVLSAPKDVDKTTVTTPASTKGKLTFTGVDYATKGTYTFKVTVKMDDVTVSRTITVNVKEPGTEVKSYELVVAGVDAKNSVDLAVASDATSGSAIKNVSFKVVGKDAAGVLVKEIGETVTYTVKHSSGTELKAVGGKIDLTVASGSAISVAKDVKTGTYTVKAEFTPKNAKAKTLVKTFNVADTQVAPTISIKDTDANGSNIEAALAPSESVVYSYDGKNTKNGLDITVTKVDYKAVSNSGNVFVKSVTVIFPVNENVSREITIEVNKTFTNVGK